MEMINDHFQNFKRYQIPRAQLVIADIPYNIGKDAYGSNPSWYVGGDRANGESEKAAQYGFPNYIPLVFRKNFSAQVLKANMRVVGCCEYGLVLYRDKLPKFRNVGPDGKTPKVHPTQKPVPLLERLIEVFTDPGDVVIDPVAGSGTTLLAAENLGRESYGFEIKKEFVRAFEEKVRPCAQGRLL